VKLRTRFVLLVVGIVIVPPLMFALFIFINALTWTSPESLKEIAVSQHLVRTMRTGELTVQQAASRLEFTEFDRLVIVMSRDGTILSPAERSGTTATVESIMAGLRGDDTLSATVLSVADENGGFGYVVVAYPLRNFAEQFDNTAIIIPLGFVLFAAALSALVIRSINRSISKLETATRRIADGDLDFELQTAGKDKIASLTRSFETMRRQLKDQFDRGSRFIMGLSHDLKTPLSSITGYIDAIRDGYADTPEKLEKYTAIIQTKTQLLETRISALIDYAKQETREWKASLRQVPLAGFLAEFVSLVETEATARRFQFHAAIEIDPDLTVEMDQDMVIRALDNLTENAFNYATPGSQIAVSARMAGATSGTSGSGRQSRPSQVSSSGGAVVITVENEGPGIDPQALPRVFDPLYRGSGDRAGPGFGLGLSTVRSVITSHGWTIDVESDPGATTRFTITIPAQ
jgi:signal transduction histidine kinase